MTSYQVPLYIVDAFTTDGNSPFTGNPAGVCLLEYDALLPDDIKQKIASEVNLSETAFVSFGWTKHDKLVSTTGPDGTLLHRRTLRWFTPKHEATLCGHATVASTKALVQTQLKAFGKTKTTEICFESKFAGQLGASVDHGSGRITLNFPSNPTEKLNLKDNSGWIDEMIKATMGEAVSTSLVDDVQYSPGSKILLLRLQSIDGIPPGDQLKLVAPDFRKLMNIDTGKYVHDIIVTIKGEAGGASSGGTAKEPPYFYSRFFAPWDGIDEDPVTGLAHTVLTPYWTKEMMGQSTKGPCPTLLGRQHSTRGGHVYCTLIGDGRVSLAGEAKVTITGQLSI
jgi:PhzF family phenazine biosynthesis protein